ncbi:MAG: hypothetical protein P1V51_00120 [Deltaproteobacteria bacterium]|nr:hypothetical protein [Deltaproteobacteria bacterium]
MSQPQLEVWSIRDAEGERKAYWKHVGRAFLNRDGSINVLLDALPLGAKLQIREAKNPEKAD